jgi:hypothetical protein
MRICSALLLFLLLAYGPCFAQVAPHGPSSDPKTYKIKVAITMSGDPAYQDTVEHFITQRLGRIKDVQIVDRGNEDICLYCIVLAAKGKDQTMMGVVLSYAVTSQTKNIVGKYRVSKLVPDAYKAGEINQYFTNGGYLVDQFTSISDIPSLQQTVEWDTDRIDSSDIKLVRDFYGMD